MPPVPAPQRPDTGDQGGEVDVLPFFDLGDVRLFGTQRRRQVFLRDAFVFAQVCQSHFLKQLKRLLFGLLDDGG